MAASEKDIENIIKMLDEASATTARINLNVAEDGNDGKNERISHCIWKRNYKIQVLCLLWLCFAVHCGEVPFHV